MSDARTGTEGLGGRSLSPRRLLALLQRIGRSLMLPIASLPAAAVLVRLGQRDMLGSGGLGKHAHWLVHVAAVFAAGGSAIINNLPVIFALGVAIGFARKSDGSTALAALIGYLVFHYVTITLFATSSIRDQVLIEELKGGHVTAVPNVADTINNPTGVLGGIVIGLVAALLFQRFYRTKLPPYLAFFGGRRLVPILTAFAGLLLGVVFGLAWPPIGAGINDIGTWLVSRGALGAALFGVANRLLLPFGLHHIINTVAWFQFGDLTKFLGGAGHPDAGQFMTGFFPVMMFGLPAAAIAMWRCAPVGRRKVIGGIMISAALASFLTGVTEPIEFSFMFVAPLLYGVHVLLTGASLGLLWALGAKDGFSFSAGAIDFALNYNKASKPLLILLFGVIYFVVYYLLFTFLIRRFNLLTPGREPIDPPPESGPEREPTLEPESEPVVPEVSELPDVPSANPG